MTTPNLDKWNGWYSTLSKDSSPSEFLYGNTVTYQKGYDFLKTCKNVEDWGCGTGGFKRFFTDNSCSYIGIDGSNTPFSNIKADLATYTSNTEGLYMRHVLEHNYEWKQVLRNALYSFKEKMCLVLFTPFAPETAEIAHNLKHGVDVPDLSFSKQELISVFNEYPIEYEIESLNTQTGYGVEHVIYIQKKKFAFYTYFYGSDNNPAFTIPPVPSKKYKCYYYTNNQKMFEMLKNTEWIGVFDNIPTTDDLLESNMVGKRVKACPHHYQELNTYDYLCFFDSKVSNVTEESLENFANGSVPFALREHCHVKGSVWDEFNLSIPQHRYKLQEDRYKTYINQQASNGLKLTTPIHFKCGVIMRNMKSPKTIEINNAWYDHINQCGIQDQISFFFVKQMFEGFIGVI